MRLCDVRRRVHQSMPLPPTADCGCSELQLLTLEDTFQEQGSTETAPHISCVMRLNLWDGWRGVDASWEGITGINGRMPQHCPHPTRKRTIDSLAKRLPDKLTSLRFADLSESLQIFHIGDYFGSAAAAKHVSVTLNLKWSFDRSIWRFSFPAGLEELVADWHPSDALQKLHFGERLNCSVAQQNPAVWTRFQQTRARNEIAAKSRAWHRYGMAIAFMEAAFQLMHLAFGDWFTSSLDDIAWPPHLETLVFGHQFDQSLVGGTALRYRFCDCVKL
eukprot:s490_g36.t1